MKFLTGILMLLMVGGLLAEDVVPADAVVSVEETSPTGAAVELAEAQTAIEKENYPEAMRHLSRIYTMYSREVEWLPAALFYEALMDERMGANGKKFSALDELHALYPENEWCRRAEKELMQKETEKEVSK